MKKVFFIIFLCLGLALVLAACSLNPANSSLSKVLTPDEAKATAEKFINEKMVDPTNQVTITDITEVNGIYKITVQFQSGDTVESYMTKDGQTFFTQGYDMVENSQDNSQAAPVSDVSTKTDKPSIELFVMSHCPYGTQIEKGLLPVLALLKDKVDFQLRFCDYSMHGQQELNEELAQTCIQKEQDNKLQSYLGCFLTAGDSASCLNTAGIDKTKLNACVAATDAQYKVTEDYNNNIDWVGDYPPFKVFEAENQQYGVQGSPTLIINGEEVSAGRDPQSLLNAICTAFNTLPAECSQQLDNATPDPGFGTTTGDASSTGGCAG